MIDKDLFKDPRNPEELMWHSGEKKQILHTPIFNISSVERTSRDGAKKSTFVTMDATDWILVIPWFRDKEGIPRFIMEQQYRHGTGSITWEFPGGLVDEGEEALHAAERELLEETGLKGKITLLGNVSPNAAFMSNRQNVYLAEDLEKVSGQSLDENEEIDVFSIPVEEALKNMGTGIYDNGTMMLAIGYFMRYAESHPYLRSKE